MCRMPPLHLVTGATDGIGVETAVSLAKSGAVVLVHGRSQPKAEAAAAALRKRVAGARFEPVFADLASLDEVRALAAQVQAFGALDGLVNNAGVFMQERRLTPDGRELTLAVNHDAPVLLIHLLLPALERAPQGRVVLVASVAHHRGAIHERDLDSARSFDGYQAYAQSKLANVLFARELGRRLGGTKVTTASLHPGVIATKLLRAGFSIEGAPVATGAETSVYCATAPELAQVTGRYFVDAKEATPAALALDDALAKRFYEASCVRVGATPLR